MLWEQRAKREIPERAEEEELATNAELFVSQFPIRHGSHPHPLAVMEKFVDFSKGEINYDDCTVQGEYVFFWEGIHSQSDRASNGIGRSALICNILAPAHYETNLQGFCLRGGRAVGDEASGLLMKSECSVSDSAGTASPVTVPTQTTL
ncbi:hypothetical protein AAFF_G00219180 [Aldrovandia affinis]|uniref:Uncharacterized protein n=1 Tax=Aldrovandia affinis TaxID=143900 RepID=A0AAD7WVJ6_9TELE|nr:hypothetical protein AAFF_G00219180 [Aldrovandia affinis]